MLPPIGVTHAEHQPPSGPADVPSDVLSRLTGLTTLTLDGAFGGRDFGLGWESKLDCLRWGLLPRGILLHCVSVHKKEGGQEAATLGCAGRPSWTACRWGAAPIVNQLRVCCALVMSQVHLAPL